MSGRQLVAEKEQVEVGEEGAAADGRPMRADARRNYERLVAAARAVFTEQGGGASMEAIAKQAGVGIGTLYRHFPKRIDIVEAVYRSDVDGIVASGDSLGEELGPWDALAGWLEAFLRYARGKRVFLSELQEAFGKNPQLKVAARERINGALQKVLSRAQDVGAARGDVDAEDVMALIGPMCTSATLSEEQGERLLTMVLDGLRMVAK